MNNPEGQDSGQPVLSIPRAFTEAESVPIMGKQTGTAQNGKKPRKPRRQQRSLTDSEWLRIQTHYETDPERIGLRLLAKLYDIPEQTMFKRSAMYRWQRRDTILVDAKREIEQSTRSVMKQVAAEVSQEIARKTLEDLQPWIERKKRRHIKSLVTLGEKGISRVRKLMKGHEPVSPKDEAFTSKTADTWDSIIRRNLGMNDVSASGGTLSLNILMGQAVINQPSQSGDQ